MQAIAQHATDAGYNEFRWHVLKDNEPARRFYGSPGALPDVDWDIWNLTGEALKYLVESPFKKIIAGSCLLHTLNGEQVTNGDSYFFILS